MLTTHFGSSKRAVATRVCRDCGSGWKFATFGPRKLEEEARSGCSLRPLYGSLVAGLRPLPLSLAFAKPSTTPRPGGS